jgi:hypothetical protein
VSMKCDWCVSVNFILGGNPSDLDHELIELTADWHWGRGKDECSCYCEDRPSTPYLHHQPLAARAYNDGREIPSTLNLDSCLCFFALYKVIQTLFKRFSSFVFLSISFA